MVIRTDSELVRIMLNSACKFIETFDETQWKYCQKIGGYEGPKPKRFQPSSGDKMILRKMMEEVAPGIPSNYRGRSNAEIFGRKVLLMWYYPAYDGFNQRHHPE